MVNERLNFRDEQYKVLDIVDHLARYSLVKNLCENKNVLDAACGEGYGSFLIAESWNAKSVTAIDISQDAIESARENFQSSKIKYICHDLDQIENILTPKSFDIVISLETIEHLKNPETFLATIKNILKPDGIVIISCPNDYWWYQNQEDSNPYHLCKYHLNEFQGLCQQYLGKVSQIMIGTSVVGIGNIYLETERTDKKSSKDIISNLQYAELQKLPICDGIDSQRCSYFLGIWGLNQQQQVKENFVIYPSLLEVYRQYGYYLNNNSLDQHLVWLENRVKNLDNEVQETQSQLQETQSQLQEIHSQLQQAKEKILEIENSKFWKLRNLWFNVKNMLYLIR